MNTSKVMNFLKNKNNLVFVFLFLVITASLVGGAIQIYSNINKPRGPETKGPQVIPDDKAPTISNTPTPVSANENYFDANFLKLTQGFRANIFARELGKVRAMTFDVNGNMYASIQDQGKVVVFRDTNGDGIADISRVILSSLNKPHGVEVACLSNLDNCYLFVAETDKVNRYDLNINNFELTNPRLLVTLPADGLHVTRSILLRNFNGTNYLMVSIGSSCNVCEEKEKYRAKILRIEISSGVVEEYSSGLRNSVFMTYDPLNGNVYATEMGRDWLGDNVPPDEINLIEQGKSYGWPYCYGQNIIDKSFNTGQAGEDACTGATAPVVQIQAHSAPLGIRFMPNSNPWGEDYKRTVFVAYHGSWNREEPTGYKVVVYKIDENGKFSEPSDFITGFLTNDEIVQGRPVDIIFDSKGAMFVSDDKEGRIYRIVKQ